MMSPPQLKSALWTSIKDLFLLPKPPEVEYPVEPSELGLPTVQI